MQPPVELCELLLRRGDDDLPSITFLDAAGHATAYSRATLTRRVDHLAQGLASVAGASVTAAPRLAAILASSQELQVLAFLASLRLGLVPALLSPPNRKIERSWYLRNMAGVLREIRPAMVLTDLPGELAHATEGGGGPMIVGLDPLCRLTPGSGSPRQVRPGTAFVQFSSGTTGIKKGVEISFDAARLQLEAYGAAIGLQPTLGVDGERVRAGDAVLSWLPLYHDMGLVAAFLLPLACRTSTVMMSPIDWVGSPNAYVAAAGRFGSTVGWHPNFAFALMASRPMVSLATPAPLARIRALVNCSEPVTAHAQAAFARRFAEHGLAAGVFTGCYAMAETVFAVSHGAATDLDGLDPVGPSGSPALAARLPMVTVGSALDGVDVAVVTEQGSPAADLQVGELVIRAPFLASGYIGPDASGAFHGGAYRSGDLGYRDGDRLYVVGRKKDLLIVGGHNVYPEDVERIVGAADGVKPGRVAAFGVFDDRRQTDRIVVVAEADPDASAPDVTEIAQQVLASLGAAVAIRIVPAGWLIKSSSGKVARGPSAAKWTEEELR